MLYLFKKLQNRSIWGPAIFFVLFYLYLWLVIKPCVIYHGGGEIINFPVFYKGWAFFHETVWSPGGLVKYISAFLSQLLYINWAGAIVLTIHAWLTYVCVSCFLKAVNVTRLRFISLIPAVLLLAIYNGYTYHFTRTTALLTALAFFCLYIKAESKNKWLNALLFLILSILLYMIADGAFLLFAVACGIYEILFKHQFQTGLLCLISAVALPYLIGVIAFNISITNAYDELLPTSWEIAYFPGCAEMIKAVYALYLFLPVIAIALGIWRYFTAKVTFTFSMHKFGIGFELLAIFLIAAAAIFFSCDSERKAMFEVDYYASEGNWHKAVLAGKGRPLNHSTVHMLNRVLYNAGRLPYDMFSYPQHISFLLLTFKQYEYEYWRRFYTLYDLGTLGHCERELVESLETYGERPVILKYLATVKMAKGELPAARVYLGALDKTLFYSSWAENYLRQLESGADLSADEEIRHLRSIMPKENEIPPYSVENIFSVLLERNKQNRMAFEYMMAWYMLSKQLDKFVQNIYRLDDFDYPQIPRLYEEAILIHMFETKEDVDLDGRSISGESQQRFKDFLQGFYRYGGNRQTAPAEMAGRFGDSYFFYYFYGSSWVGYE